VQEQALTELFRRELDVDPLQHPCVGVAHRGRDDLVREGRDAHPAAVGAAQIVRRAALDSGAPGRVEQIAAHVGPRREEQVLARRVFGGVSEKAQQGRMRDDEAPVTRLALGPAQMDPA